MYYLIMTWPELKEALTITNVAIVSVGAQKQHVYHLA